MIKKIYKHQYGKYFLSLEADPGPDKIVVKYRKRNRKDYAADDTPEEDVNEPTTNVSGGDTEDYTADTEDTPEPTDDEPTTNDDGDTEDYTTDDEAGDDVEAEPTTADTGDTEDYAAEDEPAEGGGNEDETEISDETDTGEDDTDYTDGGDDNEDGGDSAGEDGGDDTDYTDDAGDDGGNDSGDSGATDQAGGDNTNTEQDNGPGLDFDSTRKYVLFNNFTELINGINNYISKLETLLGEDLEINHIMKTCVKKLRAIRDLTYDYLVMKFEISSYIQAKLFYTNMIAMIQSVFSVIWRTNHILKLGMNKKKTK